MSTAANRRRRLLNEEARAAGSTKTTASDPEQQGPSVRRYASNDDSASFALARRVLPHRRRSIFGVAMLGILGVAALLAAHEYRADIGLKLGIIDLPALDLASGDAIARWAAEASLLALGGLALTVYGLRRRRTDDVRGAYRWWLTASLAAVACSLASGARLHEAIVAATSVAVGVEPAAIALWGSIAATLVLGALVLRVTLDLKHSGPALTAAGLGFVFAAIAGAATCGVAPESLASRETLLAHGGTLGGILMAVVSLLLYSRRIVLEADGVVEASAEKPTAKKQKKPYEKTEVVEYALDETPTTKKRNQRAAEPKKTEHTTVKATPEPARKPRSKSKPVERVTVSKTPVAAKTPVATKTQWTDGSDLDSEYEEDQPRRKLTKAERKRLRKLKANQNRAA